MLLGTSLHLLYLLLLLPLVTSEWLTPVGPSACKEGHLRSPFFTSLPAKVVWHSSERFPTTIEIELDFWRTLSRLNVSLLMGGLGSSGGLGSGINPNLGTNHDILSKWVIIAILNSSTAKWWNYPVWRVVLRYECSDALAPSPVPMLHTC